MILPFDQAIAWLLHFRYLALFPIVVAEGPIATILAGFFCSLGYLNFILAYLIIVAGDITGDAAYYAIGRWGREKFIGRWGKYIGRPLERIDNIEKHFQKHGSKTLFIGKMAHGIGAIFLVAAGLVRMPFIKFISANFIATLFKSLILLLIGYFFGQAIVKINSVLEFISAASISAGLIAILFFFHYYKKSGDKKLQ